MTVVSNYTALLSGSTWYYGAPGQAVFLTYSFSQQATAYVQATNPTAAATFQPFTDAEKADARAALTQWSLISGITIVEVTQHEGDITFGNYDLSAMGLTGASGVGHYPVINVATGTQGALSYPIVGNQKQNPGGDVYIDNGVVGTGDDLHYLLLHETGHTLGLKHPFDGTVTLDPSLDNRTNTVMSYNGPPVETTPSPLDVQAIEYLYGTKATATTTVTLNWDAATESLTEQCSADAQFVRGENGDDTITATGSYDAVDAGQGNDVIYAAGKPIDVDGGPGDDTVHTGLNYAGLSGGVHGSGNFVYLFTPGGDFVTFENVETLIFNDGTYDTATGNFVACFAAGTRILAERGQVAVEDLLTGARVLAHTGDGRMSSRRIIWIGHRSIDCRRHPKPWLVWPVRVMADAFGPGRPRRDVFLSPDHAVFVDGVLIPIRYLINGRSVAQVPAPAVTYFHVELARHAVLSAEGLPAESYLDTGHRADFTSRGHKATLHPDVASLRWEAEACAPLIIAGPKLAAVRRWVNARAAIAADPRVFAAPSSGFGRTEDTGEPLMS